MATVCIGTVERGCETSLFDGVALQLLYGNGFVGGKRQLQRKVLAVAFQQHFKQFLPVRPNAVIALFVMKAFFVKQNGSVFFLHVDKGKLFHEVVKAGQNVLRNGVERKTLSLQVFG